MIVTRRMIKACEYKEFISPDEWALRYYHLEKESAIGGGAFSFKFAPHTQKPLQVIGDENVNQVALFFASQAGKTTVGMIALNWYMDNIGGNAMFFLPSDELVPFTATDRILPSINRTINKYSVLEEKEDRSLRDNTKNIRYLGGTIRILSSAKSANRKSTPARLLIMDEISEMTHNHVGEISERAKTYEMFGGKILKTSTIMFKDDPIDLAYKTSEVRYEYAVKCPYCDKEHIDDFLENIAYPSLEECGIDESLPESEKVVAYAQKASERARYKCPHCEALWDTKDKDKAISNGDWLIISEAKKGKSVGFRATSFISRFVSIEKMTYEFLLCDTDEKKMTFYRGWLSKIYEPKIQSRPIDDIYKLKNTLEQGELPEGLIDIFCSIDVQKDHYYYSVVAVNSDMDKFVIDYGRIESESALINFMLTTKYEREDGNSEFLSVFAIDSGYNRDEIYKLCFEMIHYFDTIDNDNRNILELRNGQTITAIPIKGSSLSHSEAMKEFSVVSYIEKSLDGKRYADSLQLHTINTYFFKDALANHINRTTNGDIGQKLFIHADMRDDICISLTSEAKMEITNKKGRVVYQYEPIRSHPFNHYWDTLVYNLYLIEKFDTKYRAARSKAAKTPRQKPKKAVDYLDEF